MRDWHCAWRTTPMRWRTARSSGPGRGRNCWPIHSFKNRILEFNAMSGLTELPEYEVFALRYAHMPRVRRDNFIGGDPQDRKCVVEGKSVYVRVYLVGLRSFKKN